MTIRYKNRRHAVADRVMAAYEWLLTVGRKPAAR